MSTDCENYWQAVQDVAEIIVAELADGDQMKTGTSFCPDGP